MALDEPSGLDLELLAASFREDLGDVNAFVEGLAAKLADLLPTRVRVDRRRTGFRGPKVVERIEFDAGDRRLELRYDGRSVETRNSRLSGGIVLKSDTVTVDLWLAATAQGGAAQGPGE